MNNLLLYCYLVVTISRFDPGRRRFEERNLGAQDHLQLVNNVPVELLRVLSGVPETVGFVEAPGPRVILLDS